MYQQYSDKDEEWSGRFLTDTASAGEGRYPVLSIRLSLSNTVSIFYRFGVEWA